MRVRVQRMKLKAWKAVKIGIVLLTLPAVARSQMELVPGTRYDPDVPRLAEVVGHDFGEEISSSPQIEDYLQALAEAVPGRVHLIRYGETWEGRPLYMLLLGTAERMARKEAIQADLQRLADPRQLTSEEAERLVQELPVVTMFLHAVHGAEISPSDAALALAYHLLAARNDPAVDAVLRESLIIIDPQQNPDGRAKLLYQNLLARAYPPDPDPFSAEHDEPWPGGRSNHYSFDLGRDWFAQTQVETRGKVKLLLEWFPHVVVDLHEMAGGDVSYFFPPPRPSQNPYATPEQEAMWEAFGHAIAARFDARGFAYFTRELYGTSANPGGGSSWPLAHGIISMLFEQGTPLGLKHRRVDGTFMTYEQGVVGHFTAALATAETAARHREEILNGFLSYRRLAIQEGERGPTKARLIPPGDDPGQSARLARTLARNGIEVRRVEGNEGSLPEGTFVIPLAQPAGRVARNLLNPDVSWSLPLLYDIECIASDTLPSVSTSRVSPDEVQPDRAALPEAKVAYMLPWNATTAAVVAEALRAGVTVRAANRPYKQAGRWYPLGSAIIRTPGLEDELKAKLDSIVAKHRADVTATDSGFPEEGISLGSNRVRPLPAPKVVMAWDEPTQVYSAGWARFVLERRYGQPVTIVRVRSLPRLDLGQYNVLILPAGDYSSRLGDDTIRRLKDWMELGGTLITLAEASRWAARQDVGLLATSTELADGAPETEPYAIDPDQYRPFPVPFEYGDSMPAQPGRPDPVSRALLRVTLNPRHWLSAGTDGEIPMTVSGRRVLTPIGRDLGYNVGVYAAGDQLLVAGRIGDRAKEQRSEKAALIHQPVGRGQIVAFAEDPNAYGFSEATSLLFMNAVLLGPAHLPPPPQE